MVISSDIIALIASAISIFALLITFLNYRRDRNKTNQDYIFQEKVIAYKDLIYQASESYELLFQLVQEVQDYEGTNEDWVSFYEKECGNYYKLGYDFQKVVFRCIPILPNDIYLRLDEFSHESIHFVTSAFHKNAELTITAYDNLELTLKKIIELIRIDLKVEKLNVNLSKRLE
ncbi:hypothetical protein HYN48_13945 [Flavobacterium magnum]|uniref:DUF4760 domain-containing protein n=1 Tax=Flavobacterium magnum TaxID=2162713 RepID=A0A2S0RIZ7_9FLAO|nr:hypothetical protein [Flavobacterium magnum]AWA31101.1 hypothetical protein HYN48_13945 [Flavobacterium magnum]